MASVLSLCVFLRCTQSSVVAPASVSGLHVTPTATAHQLYGHIDNYIAANTAQWEAMEASSREFVVPRRSGGVVIGPHSVSRPGVCLRVCVCSLLALPSHVSLSSRLPSAPLAPSVLAQTHTHHIPSIHTHSTPIVQRTHACFSGLVPRLP